MYFYVSLIFYQIFFFAMKLLITDQGDGGDDDDDNDNDNSAGAYTKTR